MRIDPHFHDIDQFQVVVQGFCKMGKTRAASDLPICRRIHALRTHCGREDGFAFFTLRPIAVAVFPVPGNRHHMGRRAALTGPFDAERKLPGGRPCEEALIRSNKTV